jgi:VWFA-related protein
MKKVTILVCLIVMIVPLLLPAQEYKVEVTDIQVWVKAMDSSGKPVEGLKQQDFEVYEDEVRMDSTCFEETRMTEEQAIAGKSESVDVTAPAPAPAAARKFVLFLDLYNTSPSEYGRIRPKMQEFVDQLKERDAEIMVAALMPTGKLGIIAPFTRNLDAVHDLLNRAPANAKRDQRVRNNERQIEQIFSFMNENTADTMFRNAYSLARQYADEERSEGEYSLAALESFAAHLVGLRNGEHAVILFVSGGFNADPGRFYYDTIDKIAELRGYSVASSNWRAAMPNSVRQISFDIRREVQNSIGRLNRYNVTVYSINTRGMYVPGGSISAFEKDFVIQDGSYLKDFQESLAEIADETGGTSFMNSQNFKLGFDRVLEDLDHQYMICFTAPAHAKKGEYHKIKVVVNKPDVKLRYRQGYVE